MLDAKSMKNTVKPLSTRNAATTIATAALVFFHTCMSARAGDDKPEPPFSLEPQLALPDQVLLEDDFSGDGSFDRKQWSPRQGTRWEIKDGVLRGIESTAEFKATHSSHKGFNPRINAWSCPREFIATFSVRFTGGEITLATFIEFGRHVCRTQNGENGLEMVVEGSSIRIAEAKGFRYELGKWYRVMAERKGDEVLMQIQDGPTLYGKHPGFAEASVGKGLSGVGFAGPRAGVMELDDVVIWSVKPEPNPKADAARKQFPMLEKPVNLREKTPER